jgi:hypothetical protein
MSTTKRLLLTVVGCALLATAGSVPAAHAQGKPNNGCPPGFNLGPVTIDQAVALPRSQAAMNAGLITEDQLRFSYTGFDRNQNSTICAQLSHGFEVNSRPFGEFFYNFADDNASVPTN